MNQKTKDRLAKMSPIDLVKAALADAKIVLPNGKYEPNATAWHAPSRKKGVCRICLAGALMAQTLREDIGEWVQPHDNFHGHNAEGLEDEMAIIDNFLHGLRLLYHTDMRTENGKSPNEDYPDKREPPSLFCKWEQAKDVESRHQFFVAAKEALAFHARYPENLAAR